MAIIFAKPDPFKIVRGTRWTDSFRIVDEVTGVPIDLTGITGILMRIRTRRGATTTLLELSVANTRLVVTDPATGLVSIDVSSAVTNTLPAPRGDKKRASYVYDALIERSADEWEAGISSKVIVNYTISHPLDDA